MNKEIIVNNKTYLFVEISNDAHSFREKLMMDGAGLYVSFEPRIEPYSALQSVKISKDNKENYQIISTTKDITEEKCKNIIEYKGHTPWFKNYVKGLAGIYWFEFLTAKKSLQSLIQSNGLDISKNYLILLKLQNNE